MNFKIGQKVKVVSSVDIDTETSIREAGDIFTINYIENNYGHTSVAQNGNRDWCNIEDLVLVPTAIFTKLPKGN